MNVLVTGGAGFIGTNLCARLLRDGHQVICLDDLSTGRRENLAVISQDAGFRFVEHDVRAPYDYEVDAVFNLACPASPPRYQADPVKTLMTSVAGAAHALELGVRRGARVVQASTSEVYGDPLEHPQEEGYRGNVSCTGPRSCYDEGKRAAETLCFDYARTRGADVGVVRIFNTYGPLMDAGDGRVVSNFISQALSGQPLTVYGTGTQTRSFCFVEDTVEALIRMMFEAAGFAGPVNVGNPSEFTIMQLAELVREQSGSTAPIRKAELPPDDPKRRCPSIKLAQARLGWSPKVELKEGLSRTMDWFRGQAL